VRAEILRNDPGTSQIRGMRSLMLLAFVACGSGEPLRERLVVADVTPTVPGQQPEELFFPGATPYAHADLLQALATDETRQFKPVGTTNLVFRMQTRGEHTGAFKAAMERRPDIWKSEVAAYRLGRLLRLDNVAPAISRRVSAREIHNRLHRRYEEAWDTIRLDAAWDEENEVVGAAIYWIPEMRDPGFDRNPRQWRRWLRVGAEIPEEQASLARDLSAMVAYDYLIANFDRYSGGNLHTLPDRSRVLLRDHDVAFPAQISAELHERLRSYLERVQVFSRSLVERVVAVDRRSLEAELARDPIHVRDPILTTPQIDAFFERRATFLSYVGALVDEHGMDAVLAFE